MGEDGVIENCSSPPSQMIVKQSYEKRKGPFLINMWEVDFPCKAGLLRRKVCVCPLFTDGLCRKQVRLCRRLCLHLGYFRWSLQRGPPDCFTEPKRHRGRKMGLYAYQCVCACVWLHMRSTCFCVTPEVLSMPFPSGGGKQRTEVKLIEQTSAWLSLGN